MSEKLELLEEMINDSRAVLEEALAEIEGTVGGDEYTAPLQARVNTYSHVLKMIGRLK